MKYLAVILYILPVFLVIMVSKRQWMQRWNVKSVSFFALLVAIILIAIVLSGIYHG